MKALVEIVLVLIPIGIGYLVGRFTAPKDLSKSDRKELTQLRGMQNELIAKASEHATLGDDFAVLALPSLVRGKSSAEK